jgi:outer membrane protein
VLRYFKAAAAAVGFFAIPAVSSILTQSGPLTLEQCIAMALESNVSIEVANERIAEKTLAVKEASTANKPKLSAQAVYTRLGEATTVSGVVGASPIMNDNGFYSAIPFELDLGKNVYNVGVTLTQPIYTGGKITAAKQIAGYGLSASEWQRKATVREVKRDVTKAYYNILAARKSLVALDSAISMMEVLTKDLSNAVEVGMRGEHELLQAQVQLLNQRLSRQQASSGATAAADYLSTLIGHPVNSDLDLVKEIEHPETLDRSVPDLTALQARARDASADLKALEEQVSIIETSAKIAGATRIPTVALQAGYSGQGTSFEKDYWNNGFNASLIAQWDFYDWGAASQKKSQALSQKRQLELSMENLRTMIDMQVKNTMISLEDAFASIETSQKNIEQSKRSYEISYDRFQEGALLSSELLTAQNSILQAEISYYAALSNFYAKLADMDYLVKLDD